MNHTYQQYIRSSLWRRNPARLEELERSLHRCRLCNRAPPEVVLTVHHRTYERFGHERPEDLTTLCTECHFAVTDRERSWRYAKSPVYVQEVRHLVDRTFPKIEEEALHDLLIAAYPDDRRRALDYARGRVGRSSSSS